MFIKRNQDGSESDISLMPFVGIAFIAVIVAIGYGIFGSDVQLLSSLRDPATARGLITFLVAVTTVSLALMIAIYAMGSTESKDDLKERFSWAKEVLTILVGILGTILGFYYGTDERGSSPQVAIAEVQVQGVDLITYATGGMTPYRYTVRVVGRDPDETYSGVVSNGWIRAKLKSALKEKESISIEIIDARDRKATRVMNYDEIAKQTTAGTPDPAGTTGQSNPQTKPAAAPAAAPATTPSKPAGTGQPSTPPAQPSPGQPAAPPGGTPPPVKK